MIETIITSIVSLVVGIGTTLLFYPQTRKEKNLQNEAKQAEEWRKLYDEERNARDEDQKDWIEERDRLDAKIDELYLQINKHRDEKAEVIKRNTTLEVENTRLSMLKCEVVNCSHRQPPTGY